MYYVGKIACDPNYLMHYGVKGQKWYVRRYQNYDGTLTDLGRERYRTTNPKSPDQLLNTVRSFKYKEFDRLMSPEEVEQSRSGSCHDQVMYEVDKLRKMGLNPQATFVIEYNNDSSSGMTHSYVTYRKNGKTYWFENAWGNHSGIREFNSSDDVASEFRKMHANGTWGNSKQYTNIEIQDFNVDDHSPGEDLQEFVYKCLK